MKITIPENLKGKELYKFLIENKVALISQKKSMLKRTEAIFSYPSLYNVKEATATKADPGTVPEDATSVRVKVVANAFYWCDSQYDVLIKDCAKKSMKDRKGMIPHLHDHIHQIGAEVGDVVDISQQDISLADLGLNMTGTTPCIVFETDIKKSYNEVVFNKYKNGKIKQHSIGLMYVQLELAINDEESEKEFDFWTKYYDQVLNKDTVDESGFFWVVSEIKLLENSAVLFGSNELTPTLDVKADTVVEPAPTTQQQPPHAKFDLSKAIKETQFIKL